MRFSIISVAAAVCLIAGIQAAPTPQGGTGLPGADVGGTLAGVKTKVTELTSGGTSGGANPNPGTASGTTASSGGSASSLDGPAVSGAVDGAVPGLKTILTGPGRKRSEQGAEVAGTATQADPATQAGQGADAGTGAQAGGQSKSGNVVQTAVGAVKKVVSNPDKTVSAGNVVAPAKDAVQKTTGKLTGNGAQTGLAGGSVSKLSGTAGM
ncbi:hypothetical protein BDC45DRAFT_602074 [Circinella umbellata]|nr:hypothetical protein BDC45DRAFT_602074 [Circinella umbellata]